MNFDFHGWTSAPRTHQDRDQWKFISRLKNIRFEQHAYTANHPKQDGRRRRASRLMRRKIDHKIFMYKLCDNSCSLKIQFRL